MYQNDIKILQTELLKLPKFWDGKVCVLELKKANYNWQQMEWFGWYLEYKVKDILQKKFSFPGDKFGCTNFDLKGAINWDFKASAKSKVILNDCSAMEQSIKKHGYHGEIIAIFDVKYDDANRTFYKWHEALKGVVSKYVQNKTTSKSRRRKCSVTLKQIILLILKNEDLKKLSIMKQGINSNGQPRPYKYAFNLKTINEFENYIIKI